VCRFIEDNEMKTTYPVVIGGENFGCGSSREHAPVALGASGGGAAASRLLVPAVLAARQTGKTVV
jgi:3-isopropylmalate/(R)-2-methylmalate dehydratase small subunit